MSKKESENVCFWLPNQCTSKMDVLTPHKLVLVFLIQEYAQLKRKVEETQQPADFGAKHRKRFCLLLLKLIQRPDMPYKDLYALITSPVYGVHPAHLEEFLKLMKMLKSVGIDVLFDLYNEIDKLIIGSSNTFHVVGLYLRKVYVTLEKMNFQEVMSLYRASVAYYDQGIQALQLVDQSTSVADCESFMKGNAVDTVEAPPNYGSVACRWSIKQSELFIAQQKSMLEEDEVSALPPKELQQRLNEIIQDRPLYAPAYFLSFLNAIRVGDIGNAVVALHRCFDRTSPECSRPNTSETKEFQYSSLNLAILHAQFGHREAAMMALRECITVAQENGDHTCLHLAHTWLNLLDGFRPPFPERIVNMQLLHACSLRVTAQMRTACLNGISPADVFGTFMANDHLNAQKSMIDLVAKGVAERTALCTVYGKHELSNLCAQVLLNSNLKSLDRMYNGEGICHVLCATALRQTLQGDFALAMVTLNHAMNRFPRYPNSRNWLITDHLISAIRLLYRGRWAEARQECLMFHSLDPVTANLMLAHITLAKQDYGTAQKCISALLSDDQITSTTRVRALILEANLQAQLGKANAFETLHQAQKVANQYHLDYERAVVDLHLAYYLLKFLYAPQRALTLLRGCIATFLTDGTAYDRGRALFLFGRCMLEVVQTEPEISDEQSPSTGLQQRMQKQLNVVLPMFEQAIQLFEKLECHSKAKDVFIFLATLCNELGMIDDRNGYACRYRLLETEHQTPRQYLNVFL
ncbi:anaphase-promoting complex subunit 5 [Anopheles darlingi]|uniref:anaphase-promoting complex subunit 5 n=1 Tax=Anopheles darlingi TaxID=43151 RepID=UPI0021004368|nr:anaphase-promoting complex subunit 5 [Anopheles darlingi]